MHVPPARTHQENNDGDPKTARSTWTKLNTIDMITFDGKVYSQIPPFTAPDSYFRSCDCVHKIFYESNSLHTKYRIILCILDVGVMLCFHRHTHTPHTHILRMNETKRMNKSNEGNEEKNLIEHQRKDWQAVELAAAFGFPTVYIIK